MSGIKFLIVVCFIVAVNGNFPEDPKPCKYEDSKCIVNIINRLLTEKGTVGDSSIDLEKLNPFPIDELKLAHADNSPVSVDLKFTNNLIHGLNTARIKNVKGFGKDLTGKHEIKLTLAAVSIIGPYKVNGKVLVLPVVGEGTSNLTLVNSVATISFRGKPVERNGEIYMEPIDMLLVSKPERVIYKFNNLFNGDKVLGDTMNALLNDNWSTIYQEVDKSLAERFAAQVCLPVITKVFSKYPYSKFFQE